MPNYELDHKKACENANKLLRLLPPDLTRRESILVSTFARLKLDPLGKLDELYRFISEYQPYLSNTTACKRGCDFCCRIPVDVSPVEVEYMKSRDPDLVRKIGDVDLNTASPCPFLKKGVCSIYNVRPYLCRMHMMFAGTAYWCHTDRCHTVEFPLLKSTEVFSVYKQLAGGRVADIRKIAKDLIE